MKVTVNGLPREVTWGRTVAQVVAAETAVDRGVAVALDGTVLPRARWNDVVPSGAVLEIVTAMQGG